MNVGRTAQRSSRFRASSENAYGDEKAATGPPVNTPDWQLRLYIAGQTPRSAQAIQNLRAICEKHLAGRYVIEVIDLKVNPALAADHQILAVPTLIRMVPEAMRVVIGNLADAERVLVGLDIKPVLRLGREDA